MRKYRPYTQHGDHWMVPGKFSKFMRRCLIWQVIKFLYYNYKIIRVLSAADH